MQPIVWRERRRPQLTDAIVAQVQHAQWRQASERRGADVRNPIVMSGEEKEMREKIAIFIKLNKFSTFCYILPEHMHTWCLRAMEV